MERLLGWYRIGSSTGAVAALLIANAIPLVGVLFFGWSVWTILTIYWLENGVVGFYNVLKMARAEGSVGVLSLEVDGKPVDPVGGAAKAVLIPFFILHYGIFWTVHGIFILTLPMFMAFAGGSSAVGPGLVSDPLALLIVIVGLFISHGISYRLNYIGRGEYLRANVARQMAAPYGRLVILHVTIILGAIAIAVTGASAAAVVVLVLLKTALDLGLHLAEHRRDGLVVPRRAAGEAAG